MSAVISPDILLSLFNTSYFNEACHLYAINRIQKMTCGSLHRDDCEGQRLNVIRKELEFCLSRFEIRIDRSRLTSFTHVSGGGITESLIL